MSRGANTEQEYHLSMDAWIRRTLDRLVAVSIDDSRTAMTAVDSAWWDSEKRIPDWTLVTRRQFDTGPFVRPWILENASPGGRGPIEPLAACRDSAPPLILRAEEGVDGLLFRDYATVEFEVDDALTAAGFPFPRAGSRTVTQRDFPAIIEAIRRETLETFGPGYDRP